MNNIIAKVTEKFLTQTKFNAEREVLLGMFADSVLWDLQRSGCVANQDIKALRPSLIACLRDWWSEAVDD